MQQIAVGAVQFDDRRSRRRARAAPPRRRRRATRRGRRHRVRAAPASLRPWRSGSAPRSARPGRRGRHLRPSARALPYQGRCMLALRPAWASWIAGTAPWARRNAAMRCSGATWASFHRPRSPWVMRPSATTAVASVMTMPAPPCANLPRWTRCQSLATPSSAEYWHIGEIMMRFFDVTPPSAIGVKQDGSGIVTLTLTAGARPRRNGAIAMQLFSR